MQVINLPHNAAWPQPKAARGRRATGRAGARLRRLTIGAQVINLPHKNGRGAAKARYETLRMGWQGEVPPKTHA